MEKYPCPKTDIIVSRTECIKCPKPEDCPHGIIAQNAEPQKKRGRKPISVSVEASGQAEFAAQYQQDIAPTVRELTEGAHTLCQAEIAHNLGVAEAVGAIRAWHYNATANRVAMLKGLAALKQSRAYRGALVRGADGRAVMVQSWEAFCEVTGLCKATINEDLRHLNLLGENLLEQQQALGLGRRELRALARGIMEASEEEQARIREELDAAEGSAELEARVDQLARELKAQKKLAAEAQRDLESARKLSGEKSAEIDALKLKIDDLRSMSPDAALLARTERNHKAYADIDKACLDFFAAASGLAAQAAGIFHDEDCTPETAEGVAERVGLCLRQVADLLLDSALEVDFRAYMELPAEVLAAHAEATAGTTAGADGE